MCAYLGGVCGLS